MNNRVMSEYERFRAARIRVDPGYTADLSVISRAFREWLEWNDTWKIGRLSNEDLRKNLEKEFGQPVNETRFRGVIVFTDAESVEEWDRGHPDR